MRIVNLLDRQGTPVSPKVHINSVFSTDNISLGSVLEPTENGITVIGTVIADTFSGNATTADKLKEAITVSSTGPVTVTPVGFDGSQDLTLVTKISSSGSSTTPIYIDSTGVPKPITSYSGTSAVANKLGTSNVGSGITPIFLSSGTATPSSSTVGDATHPVYLNEGSLTQCTSIAVSGNLSMSVAGGSEVTFNGSSDVTFDVPNATDTTPGVVSTGEQTFSGNKTFNGTVTIGNATLSYDGTNLIVTVS